MKKWPFNASRDKARDANDEKGSLMTQNQSRRIAGIIFVLVPILISIPYGMLIAGFEYHDILRKPAGHILTKFHEGGPRLILIWWAFGFVGIPLIYPVIGLHSILQRNDTPYLVAGTTFGVNIFSQQASNTRFEETNEWNR